MTMREIKFRAWHKYKKEMLLPVDVWDFGIDNEQGEFFGSRLVDRQDNLELMQFTGLKDKNGKEIYEDDVVNVSDELFLVVSTDFAAFGLRHIESTYHPDVFDHYLHDVKDENKKILIIGNKHENPGLLDGLD